MSEDVGNFSNRARDFLQSAAFLCESAKHGNDGWLPASGLLLGFACELIAKCRLMRMGIVPDRLRNSPYGHDIMAMWKVHTTLFAEAEAVVDEFKKFPTRMELTPVSTGHFISLS
ncbi:hypothetical protein [Neotabrizicola sp. sgz301269]|uniref:hypothetical protein n=1 Tax=Neotabrizicola sp. sgz301269 TaxID=3276282 RepID=UPI00376FCA8D